MLNYALSTLFMYYCFIVHKKCTYLCIVINNNSVFKTKKKRIVYKYNKKQQTWQQEREYCTKGE